MNQIFGDFSEEILTHHKILMMDLSIHSFVPCRAKETRYLSIAFIVDYLAIFLWGKKENANLCRQQRQIQGAASYIVNELLENSIKFNCKTVNYPIKFGIGLLEQNLVFFSSNCADEEDVNNLKEFIHELTTSDIEELYFRQLEKGAEEQSDKSGIGFLSIMHDYTAKLGWNIEAVKTDPEIITVTTMVQLKI
jgi:hypothetical protein